MSEKKLKVDWWPPGRYNSKTAKMTGTTFCTSIVQDRIDTNHLDICNSQQLASHHTIANTLSQLLYLIDWVSLKSLPQSLQCSLWQVASISSYTHSTVVSQTASIPLPTTHTHEVNSFFTTATAGSVVDPLLFVVFMNKLSIPMRSHMDTDWGEPERAPH